MWVGTAIAEMGDESLLPVFYLCPVKPSTWSYTRDPVNKVRASCFIQHGKFPFLGIDRSAWREASPQGLSPSLGLKRNSS